MKLSDSIKYSWIKTIRDKKNIYFIIILTICSILLMTSIIFLNTVYSKIEYNIKNDITFRSIYVSPNPEELQDHYKEKDYDYGFSKILEFNHVEEMFDSEYKRTSAISETFKNEKYSGFITFRYGSKSMLPNIVVGKGFEEDATGVAICPIMFYPSATNDIASIKKEDYLDGKKYLNTKFTIKKNEEAQDNGMFYETENIYEKTYEIIGLYDNRENASEPNVCYISPKDQKEFYDSTLKKANELSIWPKMVIVDNSQNTQQVLNEISDLGFDASIMSWIDENEINVLNIICIAIISISIGGITLISLLYLKKMSNNDMYKYGVLKALGYKEKHILFINFLQLSYQIFITYILSLIIIFIGIITINNLFAGYFIYNNLSIANNIYVYFLLLICLTAISFFTSYFFTKKKLKHNSLILIKEKVC